jgi:hypothetical protein
MSKIIQIGQLLATPNGTYVNGELHAFVRGVKPPFKEGAPSKAELSDSTGSISASFWGGGIEHWDGKKVVLSGKGMKVGEYKGTKQLSVGDEVDIRYGGAPGAAAQEAEPMPGDPVPVPNQPRQSQGNVFAAPSGTRVPGATVGMAVKIAADFLLNEGKWDKTCAGRVEAIAGEIIALSQRLERGEVPIGEPLPF